MKITLFFMFSFLVTISSFGQTPELSALSNLEGGRRVLEYFKVFNSGDEKKLKDFFQENLTTESLKQRPAEPRVEFHRQVRSDFQTLEIKRIVSANDREINLLAQGKTGGWVAYLFEFETESPHKLLGWQIEQTEPPNENAPQYETPKTKQELEATISKFLTDLYSEDKFSGVVFVAKDDTPVFQKAYGLANKEKNIPNNLETKFNLGSINKIFTRITIGQLVKQGRISFDDKLGKFLPDYSNKEAAEKVTIRHLITMKSGVGDFFGDEFMQMPKEKLRKNNDFIPLFSNKPLAFEPGTKEQYSNGGYILLGAIIEKITGKSYYEYVLENIFKPAGMLNTDSYETDKTPVNTAQGYTNRNPKGEQLNNVDTRPYRGSAAGGGYSTVQDLLKFSMALKSGNLTVPDDEGLPRKNSDLGIAGGSNGINAVLLVNQQTGYTIIVLSNYDPPSAEKVGEQIRNWTRQIKE